MTIRNICVPPTSMLVAPPVACRKRMSCLVAAYVLLIGRTYFDLIVQALTFHLASKTMNVIAVLWHSLALSSVSYAIAVVAPVITSMP